MSVHRISALEETFKFGSRAQRGLEKLQHPQKGYFWTLDCLQHRHYAEVCVHCVHGQEGIFKTNRNTGTFSSFHLPPPQSASKQPIPELWCRGEKMSLE